MWRNASANSHKAGKPGRAGRKGKPYKPTIDEQKHPGATIADDIHETANVKHRETRKRNTLNPSNTISQRQSGRVGCDTKPTFAKLPSLLCLSPRLS